MSRQIWILMALLTAAMASPVRAQEFRTVTLMSWNVGNLADTADDPANPFDDTFLPKVVKDARPEHEAHCRAANDIPAFVRERIEIDWTEDKLLRKLQAIETNAQGFVSPHRYDFAAGSGISDHWPVLIDPVARR